MEQVYRENEVWKKKNIQQHIKYEIKGMMSSSLPIKELSLNVDWNIEFFNHFHSDFRISCHY